MKKFVDKHVKKAKHKYYSSYFEQFSNDGRKQWSMINQLLNRKRKHISIDKLIIENKTITSPAEIAESLNNYFCNIARKLKTNTHTDPHLDHTKRATINLNLTPTTPHEISTIIRSFKNKSTADSSIIALKHVESEIALILSNLINGSLDQAIFPSNLKFAKVVPIHKSGSRSEISNYRPISLLPTFSKMSG